MNDNDFLDKKLKIVKQFNSLILSIFKNLLSKEKDINLETVFNRIKQVKNTDECLLLEESHEKFWEIKDHILTSDEEYFLNSNNYISHIPNEIKKNKDEFNSILELTNLIGSKYKSLSKKERKKIWLILQKMFLQVVEYKELINDYIN